jgi:carbon-monoxide dehydrogenase large subunit
VPVMTALFKQTPSPLNPLGAKGAGEVSTIPTAAAIISAIEDALQPFGVRIAQTPIMPAKLVEMIHNGS